MPPVPLTQTNRNINERSAVEMATARLECELTNLNGEMENLYSRLQPYLAQDGKAQPSVNAPSPIIGSSPAVLKLMELADRISLLAITVTNVRERLEA